MVYESDFYTTRRPYSRPLVSSYTVTYHRPITILPLSSIIQLRTVPYVPYMPYVAHKRLVTIIHTPVHHAYYTGAMIPIRVRARVRPSVLAAELNRIRYLPRVSTRSYIEEYLNSRDNILFDDEAREIRARVDSLLRRVHVYVPRAVASDFLEDIVPERMRSHDYVHRLLTGRNNAKKQLDYLSWYDVPDRGAFGTLACIKYVAGKPQFVRRPYVKVADLRPSDIRNDVNFLSYYSKNRQAAATALKQDKEDAVRRAEAYLAKAAREAQSEEERRKAAEEERLQLEMEEKKAWEALQLAQERKEELGQILEIEQQEAERKAEDAKLQAEHEEEERIEEGERLFNQANLEALIQEQERLIVEEHLEEIHNQKQEQEETDVALATSDNKDVSCTEEPVDLGEITDHEKEEKHDVTTDDETRIEEENAHEEEVVEIAESPFVEEPEGAESKPQTGPMAAEDGPQIEEVTSGDEFSWGDQDS